MPGQGPLIQYFHWYIRPEEQFWLRVKREAKALADAGFTALWQPPAYKGTGIDVDEDA